MIGKLKIENKELSAKFKKYVLPYLPYALVFWFFAKCGEAYRISESLNFINRLMDCILNLSTVLKKPIPSFSPIDLFVGLVGGLAVYGIVYMKRKNAKKWRKDMEYGSARWGNSKDIEPYLDPNPNKNIILTASESLMLNGRPKNPKHARNKNVMVVGGSGSGKTRFWLKPNLMQMHSSYCVTDPKGTILIECGRMLKRGVPKTEVKLGKDGKLIKDRKGNPITEIVKDKNGRIVYQPYEIKVLNTIDFSKSMHYNPLLCY